MQSSRVDTTDEEEGPQPQLKVKGGRGGQRNTKLKTQAATAHSSKRTPGEGVAAASAKRARRGSRSKPTLARVDTTSEEGCSDSGAVPDTEAPAKTRASAGTQGTPASSSISNYARWVMDCVLTDGERNRVFQLSDAEVLRVGSMCSGMGTEEIVLQALADAFSLHHHQLRWQSVFKAEKDKKKMAFLMRHYESSDTLFVYDNADLQIAHVKDAKGQQRDGQPQVDILTCGIVCKDISGLNNKGKTERNAAGKSGSSLHGLLGYIRCCTFDKRPRVLILECVARLGHHRQVDPDARAGTSFIHDELTKLGYVGEWANVDAKQFYLPQSRPRVYGLFLLMQSTNMSEECRAARQRSVTEAMQLIRRMQPRGPPESLCAVLSRTPRVLDAGVKSTDSTAGPSWETNPAEWPKDGPKWPKDHAAYVKDKGLAQMASKSYAKFFAAARGVLQPRAIEATWLKILTVQQATGIDVNKDLIVATAGASIEYIQVKKDMFPCVTPHMTMVISEKGQLRLASGFDALAVQGVQSEEVAKFKLGSESQSLLQDLAGNAFTASILAAYLVAAMVVT